jgi:ferredoxin, 2Fe-2S
MPRMTVIARSGEEHSLEASGNGTVMEAIRDRGISDLLAICGGCCSCATCHVHVDPAFAAKLPAMSEDEISLLEGLQHRRETSRLSCQIRVADTVDGLKVTIAPEE